MIAEEDFDSSDLFCFCASRLKEKEVSNMRIMSLFI